MQLNNQDKVFLGASFATAVIGIALIVIGFVFRFGGGFGTFSTYAQQDNDFLELKRLDMIFGLFVAAACVLVLSFLVATISVIKHNKFLLKVYCAMVALMIVVQLVDGLLAFTYSDQINQLASDDILYESLNKTASRTMPPLSKVPTDAESQFWANTQNTFGCCGVQSALDWYASWGGGSPSDLETMHCYQKHYNDGCEKVIRNRISSDAQYLGAASMGVLVVEIIASFLAGYRAYTLAHPEFNDK